MKTSVISIVETGTVTGLLPTFIVSMLFPTHLTIQRNAGMLPEEDILNTYTNERFKF